MNLWWLVLVLQCGALIQAATPFQLNDLPACNLTSLEISNLPDEENVEPCLIYQVGPDPLIPNDENNTVTYDLIVTILMVTPSNCRDHRDGALVGVQKLNQDNNHSGLAIGHNKDFSVGFRLLSVVAGNPDYLDNEPYRELHKQLLETLLEATEGQLRYIVGTCSFSASVEKALAKEYETILAAQVGPPSFYNPEENKWIFGIHVTSDDYPLASIRKLAFYAQSKGRDGLAKQPVRVLYRNESEFFYSTCTSALSTIEELGFTDVQRVLYHHAGDEDGDGVENYQDEDFLVGVADQICPPGRSGEDPDFRPAIYMCTLTEQDVILRRFRENGCLLTSLWLTPATWGWAQTNIDSVDFYQGAGQWHPKLSYSDRFFDSGLEMLEYNEHQVGYLGGYDMLVSYAIPVFFGGHLANTYRVKDVFDPTDDISTTSGREELRRRMFNIRQDTIFGAVQFDDNQRNNGREAASVQWQPVAGSSSPQMLLYSPDNQAETELSLPAMTAGTCKAGQFTNVSALLAREALLETVCDVCPQDTYTPSARYSLECLACPTGSSTHGLTGSANCTEYDDNLLSGGMLSFGFIALATSWSLALFFIYWTLKYRHDAIVRLAQIPFLLLICLGGIVSTSSILGITFQAGTGEDTDAASAGCMAAPILYSLGWVIQYGSLCAKTLRLTRIVESTQAGRRVMYTALGGSYVILIPLVIDVGILMAWSLIDPLEYQREETGRSFDDGVVTISSIGRCRPSEGTASVWAFVGPLFANHMALVGLTHFLLYKVRNINNRYQENKYLGMAAIFALEVAVVGIPILIAAQDSVEATFFVVTGIVALDNIGVLGFIFIPKMFFQHKGLEEGVTVGESILSETHRKAVIRESSRRSSFPVFSSEDSRSSSMRSSSIRFESNSAPFQIEEEKKDGSLLPCIPEKSFEESNSLTESKAAVSTDPSTNPSTEQKDEKGATRNSPISDEQAPIESKLKPEETPAAEGDAALPYLDPKPSTTTEETVSPTCAPPVSAAQTQDTDLRLDPEMGTTTEETVTPMLAPPVTVAQTRVPVEESNENVLGLDEGSQAL